MKGVLRAVALAGCGALSLLADVADLNKGWTFSRGGAVELVDLPHDGAIAGPFDQKLENDTGLLPYFGHAVYTKRIAAPADPQTAAFLDVGGAMSEAKVYVNGQFAAERPYGYASFRVPLDGLLRAGCDNEIRIEVDPKRESARWYPGLGLYRGVKLVMLDRRAHVAYNGICVRTEGNRAAVSVELEGTEKDRAVWTARIVGEEGLDVKTPRMWSPESPNLYELEIAVKLGGETVDRRRVRFGFRTLRFDPKDGFFLNGVHRQMRGVCLHHDLGSLGAAFDRDAARRQLTIMKEMGCDAIRTSHNPPAGELLDLCDEMGLMVMDEAFDMWETGKRSRDYSRFFRDWHERDLVDFLKRDRNHPCIVMWSIGNEVFEHFANPRSRVADGVRIGSELRDIVRRYDDRPVTSGFWCDEAVTNGMADVVDVFGANYLPERYAEFRGRQGIVGSETCSMVSSRGVYFFPLEDGFFADPTPRPMRGGYRWNQVSSYDVSALRPNNYSPDVEFSYQESNPHVYGEFVWTGFDYLGETDPWGQPGSPAKNSYYGIVDLCGFPKDRYYCYQAHWRRDLPMVHVLPHWTWPGREGERTPVHAYTSGDEAELFVNGVSQGRRKKAKGQYRLKWQDVVYRPGEIRVVAYRNGRVWAEQTVRTAGEPVAVKATRERWGSLDYWTFAAVDADGNPAPTGALRLRFRVRNGKLAGVGNGDPTDHDSLKGDTIRTFSGLAQAVVRRTPGVEPGLTWTVEPASGTEPDAPDGFAVKSPDGRNKIILGADMTMRILRDGKVVLTAPPLGLTIDGVAPFRPTGRVDRRTLSGTVATPFYKKSSIDLAANAATIDVGEGFSIETVARNDGVAWRFISARDGRLTVRDEQASVDFASGTVLYPGATSTFEHSYEAMYGRVEVGQRGCGAKGHWFLPLAGKTWGDVWFALKDVDVRDYPGWYLTPADRGGHAKSAFPKVPVEDAVVPDVRHRRVNGRRDCIAETAGCRSFPWRAVALGDGAGRLAEADIFYALAAPATGDWSWVKPGLCAWDWWTEWDVGAAPFKGGPNTATYLWWIDFAAEHGLPYFLVDGGWAKDLDPAHVRNEVDLPRVLAHAEERGVGVILWSSWSQLWGRQEEIFAKYAAMGVKGFKIDYFDRDDQTEARFLEETAACAAKYRLLVDWHGCQPPNGLQRTYPNIVNWEGVYGLEMAKFKKLPDMPAHDVRLVFTRFLAGPADYTPGAMRCSPPGAFAPDRHHPVVCGTLAHQIALYALFEAPLQMLADSPANYRTHPEATSFIASFPTVWDETRVLAGSPEDGDVAVVARRKGVVWFVGAAAGKKGRNVAIDTSFLGDGVWTVEAFSDGPSAETEPMDCRRFVIESLRAGEPLGLSLAVGGGWAGRFERK